ncbi:hypothetical protein PG999_000719 [Apiospora kogelbergensis]|uniref:Uncharacterized protein n=1 Tax=Apiospora kogelbergensis TaxID=1337665 RepID=A0AAW0RCR4_9PEZI
MCKQYYLDFADCGCQLQYQLEHCTHGPSSSLCLGRRSVLMVAGMPLCHQHAFYRQKQEARGQELERERAERQRKLYEWQQYWQLQQGWQQNQQPGSAGQSSRGVFSHAATGDVNGSSTAQESAGTGAAGQRGTIEDWWNA